MKTLLDFIGDMEYMHTHHFLDERDELLALIEQKADFLIKNKKGETILHYAALIGSNDACIDDLLKVVRYAIACGCKLTDQDKYGITPLHLEGRAFHDILFNYAIQIGDTEGFNVQDKNGNTPLHWFCANGRIELWVKAVANGADPYIKNKDGLMSHEKIATSNVPAKGKKQFLKTVDNVLSKLPKPTQVNNEYFIKPAWVTPEKANATLSIKAEQVFEIEGSQSYLSFFGINDKFAILNTNNFHNIVDLRDGSVKHRVQRFSHNSNERSFSHNNIWYSCVEDDHNMYIIAVDPEKGFDSNTGISLWQTNVGGSSMSVKSSFYINNNILAVNSTSALLVLNAQTGKILWRGKPKGRTDKTMPIIFNDLVYTQCH